jgi:hypothetical protein
MHAKTSIRFEVKVFDPNANLGEEQEFVSVRPEGLVSYVNNYIELRFDADLEGIWRIEVSSGEHQLADLEMEIRLPPLANKTGSPM